MLDNMERFQSVVYFDVHVFKSSDFYLSKYNYVFTRHNIMFMAILLILIILSKFSSSVRNRKT